MKQLSSIKSLLLHTAKIYRQKWWEFVELCLLAIVGAVPLVLVYAVHYLLNYSNDSGAYQAANVFLGVLYFLATLVAAYFALSAVIGCCLIANDDKRMSAWQIILSTRHYFWHFLLVWLLVEAVLLISGLPLIVFGQISSESWMSLMTGSFQAFDWRLVVGGLMLLAPIAWAGVNCFWALFALMEDGFQNISALRRARELVRGRSLTVLVRLLALAGVWLAFYFLVTLHSWWSNDSVVYGIWNLLMGLAMIAANFVFGPSLIIFGRQLYKELVVTAPKTKLPKVGNQTLVKFAVIAGVLFLVIALMTTIDSMSSAAVVKSKVLARDRQRVEDMKAIQGALASYYQEQGAYPEWVVMGQPLQAAGQIYLDEVPSNIKSADGECPVDYEYGYYQAAGGQDYVLTYCLGEGLSMQEGSLLSAGEHKLGQDEIIW